MVMKKDYNYYTSNFKKALLYINLQYSLLFKNNTEIMFIQ